MTKLILLPGMDGTGDLFAPLVDVLDKRTTVVIVQYPANELLSYQQVISLVSEILPEREPFFLLGESFSGPVALSLAAELPEGLRGVILCASFVRNPLPSLRRLRRFTDIFPIGAMPAWLLAQAASERCHVHVKQATTGIVRVESFSYDKESGVVNLLS